MEGIRRTCTTSIINYWLIFSSMSEVNGSIINKIVSFVLNLTCANRISRLARQIFIQFYLHFKNIFSHASEWISRAPSDLAAWSILLSCRPSINKQWTHYFVHRINSLADAWSAMDLHHRHLSERSNPMGNEKYDCEFAILLECIALAFRPQNITHERDLASSWNRLVDPASGVPCLVGVQPTILAHELQTACIYWFFKKKLVHDWAFSGPIECICGSLQAVKIEPHHESTTRPEDEKSRICTIERAASMNTGPQPAAGRAAQTGTSTLSRMASLPKFDDAG